jgi:hypothetical protein
MMAFDIVHFEDMRLCTPACHPASVAVLRSECAGMCDPLRDLVAAHNSSWCQAPGVDPWELPAEPNKAVRVALGNGRSTAAQLVAAWQPEHTLDGPAPDLARAAVTVTDSGGGNVGGGDAEWRWWDMVQMRPGELPYLPSHPEHTWFEAMWA